MTPDGPASGRTKDALRALQAAIASMPARSEGKLKLERHVETIEAAPAAPSPDASYLDGVRRRLLDASRQAGGLEASAAARDLRDAPWLMWSTRNPLIGLPGLLEAVGLLACRRYAAASGLINAWLLHFSPGGARIEETGHLIRRVLAENADRRLVRWREADRAFKLFDARHGPSLVAAAVLKAQAPLAAVLTATGLDDPSCAVSGYARAAFSQALDQVRDVLAATDGSSAFARFKTFAAPGDVLRFRDRPMTHALVRSVLTPWIHGRAPNDGLRSEVQGFLLRHLRDPRTRFEAWPDRREPETRLMLGWLARASFQAFSDLIDEYSSDDQWDYRKAFWAAYLDRIDDKDVWLALGGHIHDSASAVRDLNGAFARLRGAGDRDSILLIRFGKTIFCEWSNVGKLRAWPDDWNTGPAMFAGEYRRASVRDASLPFPAASKVGHPGASDGDGLRHDSPQRGYWQSSAAEFIRIRTGISLGPQHWMPK